MSKLKDINTKRFNLQREVVSVSAAVVKTVIAFAIIFTTGPAVLFIVHKLFG